MLPTRHSFGLASGVRRPRTSIQARCRSRASPIGHDRARPHSTTSQQTSSPTRAAIFFATAPATSRSLLSSRRLWNRSDLAALAPLQRGGVVPSISSLKVRRGRWSRMIRTRLTALHVMTTLRPSSRAGTCARCARCGPAWAVAHVDEDYQIALWGDDYEAAVRRGQRKAEFDAATATWKPSKPVAGASPATRGETRGITDWQLAIAIDVMALSVFSVVFGLLRWRQADKTFFATHAAILLVGAAAFARLCTRAAAPVGYVPCRGVAGLPDAPGQPRNACRRLCRRVQARMTSPPLQRDAPASTTRRAHRALLKKLPPPLANCRQARALCKRRILEATAARFEARWPTYLPSPRRQTETAGAFRVQNSRAGVSWGAIGEMVRTYQIFASFPRPRRNCGCLFCSPSAATLGRGRSAKTQAPRQSMRPEFAAYCDAVAAFRTPHQAPCSTHRAIELNWPTSGAPRNPH